MTGLRILVIDDERPALDEITFVLDRDERVSEVRATDSPTEALRLLQQVDVDAVFLDIQMPGLTGIELAQVLSRFKTPPVAVFVTAHEQHAVDAFELNAVDYVLKPVREDRIAEAVRRVLAATRTEHAEEQVPVSAAAFTRFLPLLADPLHRGRGRLARLHVPRTTVTSCECLSASSSRSGPTPGSCVSTGRCSSRPRTSTRCAWTAAGARW